MSRLSEHLDLSRCPHCAIAAPSLRAVHHFETRNHLGENLRRWRIYKCGSCGGVVSACARNFNEEVTAYYPARKRIAEEIPDRPRSFLQQAQESLHAPAGAVMLCASAVDAMLKNKGYRDGTLYARIGQAAADHLITEDMATWAHEVRLDANDQRHADDAAPIPDEQSATRCLDFSIALAELLFVLPTRVQRGLRAAADDA